MEFLSGHSEISKVPEDIVDEVVILGSNVETLKSLLSVLMISGEEITKDMFRR